MKFQNAADVLKKDKITFLFFYCFIWEYFDLKKKDLSKYSLNTLFCIEIKTAQKAEKTKYIAMCLNMKIFSGFFFEVAGSYKEAAQKKSADLNNV